MRKGVEIDDIREQIVAEICLDQVEQLVADDQAAESKEE